MIKYDQKECLHILEKQINNNDNNNSAQKYSNFSDINRKKTFIFKSMKNIKY